MAGPLRSRREGEIPDAGRTTPPHSVEAEQAVIGGLLIDALAWDQVGDLIVAEDFYRPDHQLIYTALSELIATSRPAWSRWPSSSNGAVGSRPPADWATWARWRAIPPRPPTCAPTQKSSASA